MKEVGDLPALRLSAYPSALFLAYPLHMKLGSTGGSYPLLQEYF